MPDGMGDTVIIEVAGQEIAVEAEVPLPRPEFVPELGAVLAKAEVFVQERGCCRYTFEALDGKVCALGAVGLALGWTGAGVAKEARGPELGKFVVAALQGWYGFSPSELALVTNVNDRLADMPHGCIRKDWFVAYSQRLAATQPERTRLALEHLKWLADQRALARELAVESTS